MHEEIMMAPGVYVTDFRKNATLTGLSKYQQDYAAQRAPSPTT